LGKIQAYGSDTADSDTLSSEIAFNIDDDGVGAGTLGGEILLKTSGKDGTLDTAVTIDSSQNVGIGTSSPDVRFGQKLDIANSDDYGGMSLSTWSTVNTDSAIIDFKKSGHATIGTHGQVNDDEELGIIVFRGSDGVEFLDAAYIKCSVDGVVSGGGANDMPGRLTFHTTPDGSNAAAERMRIDSSGDVTFTGDLKMADGKGIDFSAMTSPADAAGMTAEILDDYETGTWDAVVSDGTNPMTMDGSFDTGYYTKVGNLVTVSGVFYTTSLGSASGNIRITGLPFTIANDYAAYSGGGAAEGAGFDLAAAGYSVSFYGVPNSTYIYLRVWDATTGVSYMQASEWTADGGIMINFSYRAA
jgi:hypothetical protein